MKKVGRLLLSVLICQGAGILGSVFTFSSVKTWYLAINKPFFTPPSWVFGPVWTILFLLMGISLYLAWTKRINLFWFGVQLVLNVLWSVAFFGLKLPAAALINIVALWLAIVLTIKTFYPINKLSGLLLLPYLAWVSFATILNFSIWRLNH